MKSETCNLEGEVLSNVEGGIQSKLCNKWESLDEKVFNNCTQLDKDTKSEIQAIKEDIRTSGKCKRKENDTIEYLQYIHKRQKNN